MQRTAWILAGKLDSLALIIMNRDTREVVERWQFDIQVEEPSNETGGKENEGWVSLCRFKHRRRGLGEAQN